MTIKAVKTGWQVNIQPGGRGGKRVKKTFVTKAEALAWERFVQAKVQETPEWAPPKKDARKLSDLVDIWHRHHGAGLRAGADTHRRLLAMCEAMGNPRSDLFTADQFAEYRATRIAAGITPNSMNREQAYLRAVFNELIRLDHWKKENPLKKLRAFKIQERELSYLTPDEIVHLLTELDKAQNPHVALIAKTCLSTGARWGEAEALRITQARNGVIQFVQTKSSKARAVPITKELEAALSKHYARSSEQNAIADQKIFATAYSAFRDAIKRSQIRLPAGQLTHVLRHTFSSHFMMNGGNILALQKVLGHHSLAMTMRYAHLSPEHLQETRHLNPISALNLG